MGLRWNITKVKERMSLLSKELKPLQDKLRMEGILLSALYNTCFHNYEIIKGDKSAGTVQCTICGESYEFFVLDPVYAATMGKCVPAIKSDLRKWEERIEFVNRMASSVSVSDLLIINDYIASQMSQCQQKLEEIKSHEKTS